MEILVFFRVASWDINGNKKLFEVRLSALFLTLLFSTMVQILLASVKDILFSHCLAWQDLNETHLRAPIF